MSGPSRNQLVLFSLESLCFPRLRPSVIVYITGGRLGIHESKNGADSLTSCFTIVGEVETF